MERDNNMITKSYHNTYYVLTCRNKVTFTESLLNASHAYSYINI